MTVARNDFCHVFRASGASALLAMLIASTAAMAMPPPPERTGVAAVLLSNGCPTIVDEVVRAYDSPIIRFDAKAGDLLRLRLEDPAMPLEFNLEDTAGQFMVAGLGFGSGDARLILPATGVYQLRVLMSGDAARTGRQIPFRLRLARTPAGTDGVCPDQR